MLFMIISGQKNKSIFTIRIAKTSKQVNFHQLDCWNPQSSQISTIRIVEILGKRPFLPSGLLTFFV